MSFEIRIPLFEGPFDLLLFFIEREEIDIYDIPIAQITNDFLAYIHQLEQLNIEIASEFILVAATLMRIKAKMLLPKDENNEQAEDPRQELINYLLEYKKYQSVLGIFAEMEAEEFSKEKRGNLPEELHKIAQINSLEIEMQNLDLYKLLKVYESVLNRFEERSHQVVHTIVPYPYTVEGQREYVLNRLRKWQKKLSFQEILGELKEKIAVIFNFLAILELLQNRLITLQSGEGYNNFWIEENHNFENQSIVDSQ